MKLKIHTAQEPYKDSRGTVRATYQLLNARGYAVATLDLTDGTVMGLRYCGEVDVGAFVHQSKDLYASQTLNLNPLAVC